MIALNAQRVRRRLAAIEEDHYAGGAPAVGLSRPAEADRTLPAVGVARLARDKEIAHLIAAVGVGVQADVAEVGAAGAVTVPILAECQNRLTAHLVGYQWLQPGRVLCEPEIRARRTAGAFVLPCLDSCSVRRYRARVVGIQPERGAGYRAARRSRRRRSNELVIAAGSIYRQIAKRHDPIAGTGTDVQTGRAGESADAVGERDIDNQACRQAHCVLYSEGVH